MRNKCVSLTKTADVLYKNGKWMFNEKYKYSNKDTSVCTYIQFITEFNSRIEAIAFANTTKRQSKKHKTSVNEFIDCISRHSIQPILKTLPLSEMKYLFDSKYHMTKVGQT